MTPASSNRTRLVAALLFALWGACFLWALHHGTARSFTPEEVLLLDKGRQRAMELSFGELQRLSRQDPGNVAYQTLLQYHLTFPLANLVLLLVALPRMVGRERGRALEGLVEGCLLCIFYFCLDFVTRALGMEGSLSPLFASWLPVLSFGSLGAVLLEAMHT